MPLAATLATDAVFQAFQGPSKLDALLHGHSYAGNPISCAVACEALAIYEVCADSAVGLWLPAGRLCASPALAECDFVRSSLRCAGSCCML